MELQKAGPGARLSGQTVGQYQILELIGTGGMGEVYRAQDTHLNRQVAVKALPLSLLSNVNARKRFIRETRIASQVNHPYVATVFDVVEHGEDLLLVMELIEGRRLSRILREEETDVGQVVGWGLEIAEALSAIHKAGLVHRDVKPGNVMVTPAGHVKVMDFGLARPFEPVSSDSGEVTRVQDSTITQAGAGVGTLLYMSPEQVRGERVDKRSDLFSFGVLMYEAVTGTHPFAKPSVHESAAAILHEAPGGGDEPETLTASGPLRELILRLLEKTPDERYQDTGPLIIDLRAVAQGVSYLPETEKRRRKTLIGVAVSTVAVVAALILGGLWWLNRPPVWDRPRLALAVVPFVGLDPRFHLTLGAPPGLARSPGARLGVQPGGHAGPHQRCGKRRDAQCGRRHGSHLLDPLGCCACAPG